MTIQVYATEQRTRILPGQPPMTIVREVVYKNGKGRKTVRVLRGNRVLSTESTPLDRSESTRVKKRSYIKRLYKPLERRTLKKLAN